MLHRTPADRPGHRALTFVLPVDHPAGRTSVVGNFNDWTPGALTLEPDAHGTQSASVVLPTDYIAVFRYLGENDWWFDEPDADFVDDGGSVVVEHVDAESLIAEAAEAPAVPSPAERAVDVSNKKRRREARKARKESAKAAKKRTKLDKKQAKLEMKRTKKLDKKRTKLEKKRAKKLDKKSAKVKMKQVKPRTSRAAGTASGSGE
ncbi:MAG: hypothetical protein ACLGHZ_01605 [Actinomycetes bacterium]